MRDRRVIVSVRLSLCGFLRVINERTTELMVRPIRVGNAHPCDIVAELLADDTAIDKPLDARAAPNRDWSISVYPLIYRWGGDTKDSRHRSLPADKIADYRKWFVSHGDNYEASPYYLSIGIAWLFSVCEVRHFGVQPPSISDWVKRGTISKSKKYKASPIDTR